MDGAPAERAAYCRKAAEEIRRVALRCRDPQVRAELRDLAVRFERMAAAVEKTMSRRSLCFFVALLPGESIAKSSAARDAGLCPATRHT